ncbi:hypothetical protein ACFZDJ_53775 [Streptomyces sp. NPDC007896]|uniref:hypothetical protein n=1 Tax=Streptomyces sp. NPDC007896 TaxID=3364784 RepID=UPI0036F0A280
MEIDFQNSRIRAEGAPQIIADAFSVLRGDLSGELYDGVVRIGGCTGRAQPEKAQHPAAGFQKPAMPARLMAG